MPIDKYQPCPCGSGKKIKFCCRADLLSELEKLQRMLDGEQRLACLEHVTHVLEKHPRVPALLSIKAMLENELGDSQSAESTVAQLLDVMPGSPIALAERARLLAGQGAAVEAATCLQQALDATGEAFPMRVYSVLGFVAAALLDSGLIPAAHAHFLLQVSLAGEDDPSSARILMELNASNNVPLLFKQDTRFAEVEPSVPYRAAFDEALELIGRARWLAAHDKLAVLADKHGRDPAIRRNLALLRGFLGREDEAAKAWRICGVLTEPTSLEDAVEAEAMAQLLDSRPLAAEIPMLDVELDISDVDRLMELLVPSKRIQRLPVDVRELATDDSPPPRGVYSILDRDMPATGENLGTDDLPRATCDFYIYGRETDRAARIEFTAPMPRVDGIVAALREIAGEAIGEMRTKAQEGNSVDALAEAMTFSWRFPPDTPAQVRHSLLEQKRQAALLEIWPTVALTCLDGKSLRQAQGDAKYRVQLLAAILLTELQWQQNGWEFDFNQLRSQLQLPAAEKIDPASVDFDRLPLVRYARLNARMLDTASLAELFQYATMLHAVAAIENLGQELALRPDIPEQLGKDQVYGVLARTATSLQQAGEMLEKAREAAVAAGNSPARWLLTEIPLCVQMRNADRLREIIETLQSSHAREPGVLQALMNTLGQLGLLRPSGQPSGDDMAAMLPGEEPAAAGVWSPDASSTPVSQTPSPSGGSQSGLWLPGME